MGDILPPKRQAVVDRLRRRFNEQYRSHQNGCFPRYEQSASDLFQQQRHETQLLKQRYLEAKAKKVKKSDHKNVKDPCVNNATSDAQRSLLLQKLSKRQHPSGGLEESPLQDLGGDEGPERCKVPRKDPGGREHLSGGGGGQQQNQQQLPSFSVQIVQQFTSSSSAQAQQTIQTNVTVKALSGNGGVKTGHEQGQGPTGQGGQGSGGGQGCNDDLRLPGGTSISVGTNIECKRERQDDAFSQCGGFGHRDPPPGNFADTFAHLGSCFPEDSNDDVIGSDILNDINTNDFFDDIFVNPSDLMKEFNFDDSVGDPVKDNAEDKDSTSHQEGVSKGSAFQFQGFEQSSLGGYGSRMTSGYPPLSPTLAGLDFKLREPSPAAQTLKQMAEQHQSMQQKQHQIGLSPSSRSPFAPSNDGGFGDPLTLSSLRTNFLNGANMNSLSKGQQAPPQMYGSFAQQQQTSATSAGSPGAAGVTTFAPGLRPGMVFKEESVFGGLSDTLDKRVHQDAYGTAASPVDQKPTMSQGPAAASQQQHQQPQRQQPSPSSGQYAGTRPLSHFSDPHSGASPVSRQSPLGGAGSPFIRGLTPPPQQTGPAGGHFSANVPTRSPPNRTGLQMTQSQQMHLSAANQQQLQVSQSQQIQASSQQSQDPKLSSAGSQQVHGAHDGVYGSYGNFQLSMSQSQSVSFASYGNPPGGASTPPQAQQRGPPQSYMSRPPPPEYKPVAKQGTPRYAPRGPYPTDIPRDTMQQQPAFNPQVMASSPHPHVVQPQHAPHSNSKGPKVVYPSALTRNRAPNVNVGPEGLNISQRPPFEWRQLMMQQQHQQQHQQTQQRGAPRFPQCYRAPAPTSFGTQMVRAPPQQQQQPPQQRVVRALQPSQHPRHTLHQQQQQQIMLQSVMGNLDTVQQQQISLQQQMTSSPGLQFPDLPQHVQQGGDAGPFSLDFLDSIESGASDLLNFDSVSGAHFSLLDDMGMLGK